MHHVEWIALDEAMDLMASSREKPIQFINDFQRVAFELYGVKRRDPMFASELALRMVRDELSGFMGSL